MHEQRQTGSINDRIQTHRRASHSLIAPLAQQIQRAMRLSIGTTVRMRKTIAPARTLPPSVKGRNEGSCNTLGATLRPEKRRQHLPTCGSNPAGLSQRWFRSPRPNRIVGRRSVQVKRISPPSIRWCTLTSEWPLRCKSCTRHTVTATKTRRHKHFGILIRRRAWLSIPIGLKSEIPRSENETCPSRTAWYQC